MPINIKKTYTLLYVITNIFILLTPLNTYFDAIALFTGSLESRLVSETPLYIKLYKDIYLVACVMLVIPFSARLISSRVLFFNLFILLLLLYTLISLYFEGLELALIGLRAHWVILLIAVGYVFSEFDFKMIYKSLQIILCLHVIFQLLQMFYGANYFGHAVLGINIRNTGLFVTPSTAAALPLLVMYFADRFRDNKTWYVGILSVLLSNSTTGFFVLIVYFYYCASKRIKYSVLLLPFVIFAFALIVYNLDYISGRGEAVYESLDTRLDIISEYIRYLFGFGHGFGLASSSAVLMKIPDAIIADNAVVAAIINMGFIGFAFVSLLLFFSFKYLPHPLLYLSFVGFSLTMVIFEMNPIIQLYLLIYGVEFSRSQHRHPATVIANAA